MIMVRLSVMMFIQSELLVYAVMLVVICRNSDIRIVRIFVSYDIICVVEKELAILIFF